MIEYCKSSATKLVIVIHSVLVNITNESCRVQAGVLIMDHLLRLILGSRTIAQCCLDIVLWFRLRWYGRNGLGLVDCHGLYSMCGNVNGRNLLEYAYVGRSLLCCCCPRTRRLGTVGCMDHWLVELPCPSYWCAIS